MTMVCIRSEVSAESLYEAMAEAVAEFREDKTVSELPKLRIDRGDPAKAA